MISRILFATDTYKESIYFMETLGNMLYERQIPFDFDKHRMIIKSNNYMIVFVSKTSAYMGLMRQFDYYVFSGDAGLRRTGWHDWCVSRIKIGAKRLDDWDEIIKLLKGE